AAHRRGADDLAAVRRGLDDRASGRASDASRPRSGHRLRLSGRGPRGAGSRRGERRAAPCARRRRTRAPRTARLPHRAGHPRRRLDGPSGRRAVRPRHRHGRGARDRPGAHGAARGRRQARGSGRRRRDAGAGRPRRARPRGAARVRALRAAARPGGLPPVTRAVLFHGGRIHVGDGRSAEALLARDGRVAAIGPARDLRREAPDAELIDLRGGLMTPGWVDAHVHFVWWSIQMSQLDLRDARTVDEALARVAAHARALPGGAWILGGRFDRNAWGRWPTAAELDRASAGHPAALRSRDGHSRWLNSEALRRVGIGPDTTPPAGGTILRDASGAPTGILQENANDLVDAVVPPPTDAEMLEAARHGQTEAWQRGLTGFENLDAFRDRFTLATFQRLHDAGELAMRAHIGIPRTAIDEALDRGLRTGAGDDWLRVGHLKIFTDGALGSQTAALEQPYLGTDDRGVLTVEPEELARLVARAAAGGIAVAVHAIGDRAVRVALDAIAPT